MRTLVLLRHAKSSWALPGVDDFERPLNDRGVKSAPLMAGWIADQNAIPNTLKCSPALRTRTTMAHLFEKWESQPDYVFDDALYLASSETILAATKTFSDEASIAMIIAHNPGLHESALRFLSAEAQSSSGQLRVAFPTCACAIIQLPIETWQDTEWGSGTLAAYVVPKALPTE